MNNLQSHILNVSLTGVEDKSADTVAPIVKGKGKGRKAHKGEFERVMQKPYNAHLPTEVEKAANAAAPTDRLHRGKKDSTRKNKTSEDMHMGGQSLSHCMKNFNSMVLMLHLLSRKSTTPHDTSKIWHPMHPTRRQ